jgi:hypothetical protein
MHCLSPSAVIAIGHAGRSSRPGRGPELAGCHAAPCFVEKCPELCQVDGVEADKNGREAGVGVVGLGERLGRVGGEEAFVGVLVGHFDHEHAGVLDLGLPRG